MATEADWRIVPGDLGDPRIIDLLQTHVAAAMADMPRESCHALDVAGLQAPEISFWLIWLSSATMIDKGWLSAKL